MGSQSRRTSSPAWAYFLSAPSATLHDAPQTATTECRPDALSSKHKCLYAHDCFLFSAIADESLQPGYRCRSHKIKCCFHDATSRSSCVACVKSRSSCVFDVKHDGIPRGADYVSSLESRIISLEERLHRAEGRSVPFSGPSPQTDTFGSADGVAPQTHLPSPSTTSRRTLDEQVPTQHKIIETASDGVTIFNFLFHPLTTAKQQMGSMAELPGRRDADALLEIAFSYTQARYCVADWVRIRAWYQQWEAVCSAPYVGDPDLQTGAYFLWMTFAIGAQADPNINHPPEVCNYSLCC